MTYLEINDGELICARCRREARPGEHCLDWAFVPVVDVTQLLRSGIGPPDQARVCPNCFTLDERVAVDALYARWLRG